MNSVGLRLHSHITSLKASPNELSEAYLEKACTGLNYNSISHHAATFLLGESPCLEIESESSASPAQMFISMHVSQTKTRLHDEQFQHMMSE